MEDPAAQSAFEQLDTGSPNMNAALANRLSFPDGAARPVTWMIAGAQKAGTSSLQNYLGQHPAVATHAHHEITYFIDDDVFDLGYGRCFQKHFELQGSETVILGKSVSILTTDIGAERLLAHNPDVDVIVMLRDPVARAYSAYWYARRRGWEPEKSFAAAIRGGPSRFADALRRRNCDYLGNSHYARHLDRMYRLFSCERVHVLFFEDMVRDALGMCRALFVKMGVTPQVELIIRSENTGVLVRSERLARAVNTDGVIRQLGKTLIPRRWHGYLARQFDRLNRRDVRPPRIDLETVAALRELIAPWDAELKTSLGRADLPWDDPPTGVRNDLQRE